MPLTLEKCIRFKSMGTRKGKRHICYMAGWMKTYFLKSENSQKLVPLFTVGWGLLFREQPHPYSVLLFCVPFALLILLGSILTFFPQTGKLSVTVTFSLHYQGKPLIAKSQHEFPMSELNLASATVVVVPMAVVHLCPQCLTQVLAHTRRAVCIK